MSDDAKKYDPEKYWAERYKEIDITKSGHVDLPESYNWWLYRRKKERLLQGLLKAGFNPKGASVLEIATGTGVYVEMWKSLGISRLSGIDISENAVNAMKKKFPEYAFTKRDLSEPGLTSIAGRDFDLVTAVDMLYHIVHDKDFPVALQNLADACKPGGYLAIHDFFMHHREMDFGYIKLRTLAAYQSALAKAGFEIVSRTPTFFLTVQTYDYASLKTKATMDKVWTRYLHPAICRYPNLAGRLGYYSDRLLGGLMSEGPSFEMMVCRRKA
jgi:2-polyprenyl-3-methyl-5-hydroxy-6-metoxy-1,4-benzoquinol methylase